MVSRQLPKLQFRCPNCGQRVSLARNLLGTDVLCPYCQRNVRAPKTVAVPGSGSFHQMPSSPQPNVPASPAKEKRRPRSRVKLALVILFAIVSSVLLLLTLAQGVCYLSIVRSGPSTKTTRTRGWFRPGGLVYLSIGTGIESFEGKYRGNCKFLPQLSPSQKNKGINWDTIQQPVGGNWGEQLKKKHEPVIVQTTLELPSTGGLSGEEVPLVVQVDFEYPDYAPIDEVKKLPFPDSVGIHFCAHKGLISDTVNVSIDSGPLSFWERYHTAVNFGELKDPKEFLYVLIAWSGFSCLFLFISWVSYSGAGDPTRTFS
ncbi:MAG: hypothetical protein AB1696_07875 [Planctomycetota bacterium]